MPKSTKIKGADIISAPISPEKVPVSGKVWVTLNGKDYEVSAKLAETLINKGSATLKTK